MEPAPTVDCRGISRIARNVRNGIDRRGERRFARLFGKLIDCRGGVHLRPIVRNWIGTLEGFSNAEVKARVVGYVMERNYVEGAAVKKDDQLFLIDPRP